MGKQILYKYRSLRDYKYFIDILLNNRLYGAFYKDLNDPMEGHYLDKGNLFDQPLKDKILGKKKDLRICSLSRVPNDFLMWSHYADGHKGVVIGVEIQENEKIKIEPIIYDNNLPKTNELSALEDDNQRAIKILTYKHSRWIYENEARVFILNPNKAVKEYVKVTIKEIILGQNIPDKEKDCLEKLIKKINQNINVTKYTRKNFTEDN